MSNQHTSDIVPKLLVDGAELQKASEEVVQAARSEASISNITAAGIALRSVLLLLRRVCAKKLGESSTKSTSQSMFENDAAIKQAQSEPGDSPWAFEYFSGEVCRAILSHNKYLDASLLFCSSHNSNAKN